jgi:hypothetical protein
MSETSNAVSFLRPHRFSVRPVHRALAIAGDYVDLFVMGLIDDIGER